MDMTTRTTGTRAFFEAIGCEPSTDFFTLSASQVCTVNEYADAERYRKPRNANGSRARYFYARMQRRHRRGEV